MKTFIWDRESLSLIDQRRLPFEEKYVVCRTYKEVADCIRDMVVRGAPAIGVVAAYGVALAAVGFKGKDKDEFLSVIDESIEALSATRPTAVNLFWALDRMKKVVEKNKSLEVQEIRARLIQEAEDIEKQDLEVNLRIGNNGEKLFESGRKFRILTHCNAGALATSGYGTALGVVRALAQNEKLELVIVDETRPYLQGARLTSWELYQEGIPFFVITDNMAGYFMARGEVDAVIVGADRIALNGDAANKIGTLGLSIMAKYYGLPFYIASPLSSIDTNLESGKEIPIENRSEEEVKKIMGVQIIPSYMAVRNPAFDVTPASNITAIITEEGVIFPPFKEKISAITEGRSHEK
ncbi:MAG: S-methyl-5-thioribose-1-phosphate isomerase [Actinobacteria bacterium]|nr:S-methyl-5-thioribose-1-phosphate isomerase [Actinomycetota bacterium]